MTSLHRPSAMISAVLFVVAIVGLVGGVAVAADSTSAPPTYTGCLNHTTGVIYDTAIGSSPARKCLTRDRRITWNAQGPQGDKGARGPAGVPGPAGPAGAQGPAGVSGYQIVTASGPTDSTPFKTLVVNCPAGQSVLGGGVSPETASQTDTLVVVNSYPSQSTQWFVSARDLTPSTSSWTLAAYATCATVG